MKTTTTADLDRLYRRITIALAAAGLRELDVTLYQDGAVVSDGQTLWTVDTQQLLEVAGQIAEERPVERYQALCDRTTYLMRGSDEDRARHERIRAAWREDHRGNEGHWA